MPITFTQRGSFNKTNEYLKRMQTKVYLQQLERFGAIGVTALQNATPEDSGDTKNAWTYEIVQRAGYYSIVWSNTHTEDPGHIPIAVLIQYGHGTRQGGYVQGRDFINPAMRPIFDQIAADMWKEVTR